ncbi:hypothetical protein IT575_10100 [bacterium]|nr:hypothetical protein [bacterium]
MPEPHYSPHIGTSRSIWPRVGSRGAHRVVQTVFDAVNDSMVDLKSRQYLFELTAGGREYRDWLRGRLAGSDLARRLAGGIGSLPEIGEGLPDWARALERFQRPRSLEQTVWYVLRNLEWLLDSGRRPKVSAFGFFLAGGLLLAIGGFIWLVSWLARQGAGGGLSSGWWIPVLSVLPALLINLVAFVGRSQGLGVSAGAQPGSEKFAINVAEFYWYITEALADPAEEKQGELSASDILDNSIERAKARIS